MFTKFEDQLQPFHLWYIKEDPKRENRSDLRWCGSLKVIGNFSNR